MNDKHKAIDIPLAKFKRDFAVWLPAGSCRAVMAALTQAFPDCLALHRAHQLNDCIGVDVWVEHPMAQMTGVDLKIRSVDYGAKKNGPMDIALEITHGGSLGWAMKSRATQVYLFVCTDTGRSHPFDAVLLRQVLTANLPDWRKRYKVITTRTASPYGKPIKSETIYIPAPVLDAACKALQAHSGAAA